jgi:hypothetical protein
MLELLYSIDVAFFFFINHTMSNPVLDIVMPFITDLNKNKPVSFGNREKTCTSHNRSVDSNGCYQRSIE